MNETEIKNLDGEYIASTYGRLPLCPAYGKNATLTDVQGKEYIDFTAGIGVNSLGIAPQEWIKAVTDQLGKIQHISNYYYSAPSAVLAEKIVKSSKMKKVIFSNSGGEANEAAIKTARKYSFDKYGKGRSKIITLIDSFHGRTITTLSATGQEVFHNYFFPFTDGFEYLRAGETETLKKLLSDSSVCAVMCEVIQGEGGVNVIDTEFLSEVRKLCDENDILLIFDEVQTGIARTGSLYAFENIGVKPDIFTLAKGLGAGLPIGCCVLGEKCADVFHPGDHGSTFGGNPAVCAGACVVMDTVSKPEFLASVAEKGKYIVSEISAMKLPAVVEIRGKGLMIGVKVNGSHKELAKKCLAEGLMVLTAGKDVLRFLPPLTITYEEIDKGLSILKKVLG